MMSNHQHHYPQWNFVGHTLLISGAARGIGRAMVRLYSASGANVIFGDVDEQSGKELVDICKGEKGEVCFVEADFSKEDAWPKLLKASDARGWKVTMGVANTGIGIRSPIEEISSLSYEQVTDVNLRSSIFMAKHLTPKLREAGGGSLIYIGSVMSNFGTSNYSLYGMSKSGLLGLTRSLAVELAPNAIRVNCIQPGFIRGDIPTEFRAIVPPELWTACYEKFGQRLTTAFAQYQPLPIGGTAEHVAQTACFLTSAAGRFITGETIRVDGGLSVKFPTSKSQSSFSDDLLTEVAHWMKEQAKEANG